MRRLLIVAFHYPPDNTSTGVLRTLKFSEYLPRHGWHSHVISVPERLYVSRNPPGQDRIPEGVTVERTWACDLKHAIGVGGLYPGWLAVPDRYWPWLFAGVPAGARAIRTLGIDALYSTFPQPTAHLIALRLKRRFGLPWIADFRDPWVEDSMPPWRRRIEARMERAVVTAADRVICNTPAMRRDLLRSYPDVAPEKFVTITNGYDEGDLARVAPRREDKFHIIYPGEINVVNRNPLGLLRGVRRALDRGSLRADDLHITFLGAGPYGDSAEFRALLGELDLARCVEVVARRVPYHEALARTAGADVVVVLSENLDGASGDGVQQYTRQQVPAKLYEYLRLGRPILALVSEGAVTELLQQTRGGDPIAPMDSDGVAAALERIYRARTPAPAALAPPRDGIAAYSRENLTALLARELDALVSRTNTQDRRAVDAAEALTKATR